MAAGDDRELRHEQGGDPPRARSRAARPSQRRNEGRARRQLGDVGLVAATDRSWPARQSITKAAAATSGEAGSLAIAIVVAPPARAAVTATRSGERPLARRRSRVRRASESRHRRASSPTARRDCTGCRARSRSDSGDGSRHGPMSPGDDRATAARPPGSRRRRSDFRRPSSRNRATTAGIAAISRRINVGPGVPSAGASTSREEARQSAGSRREARRAALGRAPVRRQAGSPRAPQGDRAGRRSCRLDRQLLVAATRLDQAVHSGASGASAAAPPVARDARGNLHDDVIGQVGQRAAVARVDDLDIAAAVVERRDQLRGRLAVEGAAAVLEQLRLRVERRVAVQLEQVAARSP